MKRQKTAGLKNALSTVKRQKTVGSMLKERKVKKMQLMSGEQCYEC